MPRNKGLITPKTVRGCYQWCVDTFGHGLGDIAGTMGPIGAAVIVLLILTIILTIGAARKKKRSIVVLITSLVGIVGTGIWCYVWVFTAGASFFYKETFTLALIISIVSGIIDVVCAVVSMKQPKAQAKVEPHKDESGEMAKMRVEMEQMRQQMDQMKAQAASQTVAESAPEVFVAPKQSQSAPAANHVQPVATEPDTSATVRAESQQVQAAQASAKDVQPATSTKNKWIVLLIAAAVVFALARVESAVEYMSRGMPVTNAFASWQVWLYLAGIVVAFFARKHVACLAVSGVITLYWGYNTGRTFFMLLSGARFANGGIGVILGFLAPCLLLIYLGITLFQKMKHPATSQEAMLRDKLLTQTQKFKTQTDKLNNSSSGYSYLDEYKKNMNKK